MKLQSKQLFTRNRTMNLVLLAVAVLFPLICSAMDSGSYFIYVGCFIFIYIIAVSGYDILFGYCGQVSLGHAGFFAIGAYGSAILNKELGIPTMITTLLAAIIAAVVAAIIAYPAAKLKVHFLSLATQSFGMIVYYLALASPGGITGDSIGYFPKPFSLFGKELSNQTSFYFFALVMCVIFLTLKSMLVNSRTGRAFIAIRENVTAANGMGINVRKYKIIAFATSAFFTAFAGSMFGHFSRYIAPSSFNLTQSNLFSLMLLFGGKGTFYGPIIGAMFVQILTEATRGVAEYSQVLYAAILLLVVIFMSSGVTSLNFAGLKKLFQKGKKGQVSEDAED